MIDNQNKKKKIKIAWGISGAGDKIAETIKVMKDLQIEYADVVDIHVFLSKAAEQVLQYYRLETDLKENFQKVRTEINSNAPFLASWMQIHKYVLLLIAPATSNTVAKIANGIGDTLLTNAAIMSLKALGPVYVVPTDYKRGTVLTKLPNGKEMKLRIRKEEVYQVKKLEQMEDMHVLEGPQEIRKLFKEMFG
ncbi:MAG: archaeoflavoprotein AfpA [Candidatus Bathyarchaeota archaeon]|nr:archaeoflavoprotein AfpA [Candidatus Bathyarchaeota archaeon]